jgi:two-component system sensor histidine kinase CpxA
LLAADLDAMAQRLRQLLEAKQQLLRDVSHELRSPLARLQLALSLARREDSRADRHLARIACEADRLEQLIARTLKLVRLERPAHALEHVKIDIGELLRNISSDVAIEADAQGCLVTVQASGRLVVSGDPELLRSAFENIIRNAVRFSPPGALVAIEARPGLAPGTAAETAEISVRDSGPGVPEKELGSIFEPFYRVDAAREHRSAGGEGLGLAIAARAVSLHSGSVTASNAPGGGLLVLVKLPLASDSVAESAKTQTAPSQEPSRNHAA